jgi:type II secretory pathway pseudopilin PulG
MKNKIIAVLVILLTVAVLSLYFSYTNTQKLKQSLREAKNNVEVLNTGIDRFRTQSGKDAATIEALQYTLAEFKRYRAKDVATIEDLGIKLKRATSLINVTPQVEVRYTTVVKDSIIRDTVRQCFEYSDKWNTVWGCVTDKKLDGGLDVKVPLTIVGEPTYRRVFLFFRKVDGAKITVVSENKYAKIISNEYVLF